MYRVMYQQIAGREVYRAQYFKWSLYWADIHKGQVYDIVEEALYAIACHRRRRKNWKVLFRL